MSNVRPQVDRRDRRRELPVRLGATALGFLVGLLVGFVVAVARAASGQSSEAAFAGWVFGGGFAVAVVGFAAPKVILAFVPGMGQFFAGVVSGATEDSPGEDLKADATLPVWLRRVFYFGVLVGFALWITLSLV
jgi:hypothetical protein